jgi:hypothetical protein
VPEQVTRSPGPGDASARAHTAQRCSVLAFCAGSRVVEVREIGIPEGVGSCPGDVGVGVQVAGVGGLCASVRRGRGRGQGWP